MNISKIIIFLISILIAMSAFTLTAFGQGKSFVNPETGQLHKFVSGNYTDLGVNFNGAMPADEFTLRLNARTELNRLSNAGVTNVRIWAFLGYNANDFGKMANRVAWLADEAAQKNMTLVVDLFDSANNNSYQNILSNDGRLTDMINLVMRPNANRDNIYWSLGNEIGGYENPLAFASFYERKVAEMRAAGASHISFHPVPGSLEHRWGANNDTEQAARRCIEVSDDVSPHFYAQGSVSREGSTNSTEFNSLKQYIAIGNEMCKITTIGEFGIVGTCAGNYAQRTDQNVIDWLSYFGKILKVDQVSFWQFMKNTTGHLDNESFASVAGNCIGNGTHQAAMGSYLNNTPLNSELPSCNEDENIDHSTYSCNLNFKLNGPGYYGENVTLRAGGNYSLSFDASFSGNGSSFHKSVGVNYKDSNGNYLGENSKQIITTNLKHYDFTFSSPAEFGSAQIFAWTNSAYIIHVENLCLVDLDNPAQNLVFVCRNNMANKSNFTLNGPGYDGQNIILKEDGKYSLSFDASFSGNGPGSNKSVGINYKDRNGNSLGENSKRIITTDLNHYDFTFSPPVGFDSAQIFAWTNSNYTITVKNVCLINLESQNRNPNLFNNSTNLENNNIQIYPNPFYSNLTLKTEKESGLIKIMDMTGKIFLQKETESKTTTIDTKTLKPGYYLIEVENGGSIQIQKIIKS